MTDQEFQTYLVEHLETLLTRYGRWLSNENTKLVNAQLTLFEKDLGVVEELKKIYETM